MTPQRVTLITLGVKSLNQSKQFYDAIGWTAHRRSQDSIVFFQMNGLVLGLFGLEALADDQGRPGANLAITYETTEAVDHAFPNAINAGAKGAETATKGVLGRLFGLLRRSR